MEQVKPFALTRGVKLHGGGLPLHAHDDAQLTFVASGIVQVRTNEGHWFVPRQLAVWIPPAVLHTVEVHVEIAEKGRYFDEVRTRAEAIGLIAKPNTEDITVFPNGASRAVWFYQRDALIIGRYVKSG